MHTIFIYRQAAIIKTRKRKAAIKGDNYLSQRLKDIIELSKDHHSVNSSTSVIDSNYTDFFKEVIELFNNNINIPISNTWEAVLEENQKYGTARGPKDNPESPVPTQDKIHEAAKKQVKDIELIAKGRFNELFTAAKAGKDITLGNFKFANE